MFLVLTYSFCPGFPGGASGKESTCQCRRHKRCGFNPWVRKIPWSRKWYPTSLFLPRKFHGQRGLAGYSLQGHKESDKTKHNSFSQCSVRYSVRIVPHVDVFLMHLWKVSSMYFSSAILIPPPTVPFIPL